MSRILSLCRGYYLYLLPSCITCLIKGDEGEKGGNEAGEEEEIAIIK